MKSSLLLILSLISFNSLSQGLNGKIQMGGTASFFFDQTDHEYSVNSYLVQNEFKTRTISFIPQMGFFLSDAISVGGRIGYTNEKVKQRGSSPGNNIIVDNETNTSLFQIGPYIRFHKSVNDQMLLFLQGDTKFGFGKTEFGKNDPTVDEGVFEFEIGVRPGFLFMASEKLGIESSIGFLGYSLRRTKLKDSTLDPTPINKDQDFGLDLNFNTFQIGIQYYL